MIHKNSQLELGPVTVLVGSNNGGKSAVIDALETLSSVSRNRLSRSFDPAGARSFDGRMYHGAEPAESMEFSLEFSPESSTDKRLSYHLALAGTRTSPVVKAESLKESGSGETIFDRSTGVGLQRLRALDDDISVLAAVRDARKAGTPIEPLLSYAWALNGIHRFRLERHFLEELNDEPELLTPTGEAAQAPYLKSLGRGLAALLYYLDQMQRPYLAAIEKRIRTVVKGFGSFEFVTASQDRVGFGVRFSDSRGFVEAGSLSSGTLSLIGLMTLLTRPLTPGRPGVLCLEEPEVGLTPSLSLAVNDAIVQGTGDTRFFEQIIITTHSPYLVDRAWSEGNRGSTFRVAPGEDGTAEVRTLKQVVADELLPSQMGQGGGYGVAAAMRVMEGLP